MIMQNYFHTKQYQQQQQRSHPSLVVLSTFILSILSVQSADIKPVQITDVFCGWGGKCGPMTPCQTCYYTAGAYMPMCCEGKRNYGNPCFARNCGKEDISKCVYGHCGESIIFKEPVEKPKPIPVQTYPARRRRLLHDDADKQCKNTIEELCASLGKKFCKKVGIEDNKLCRDNDSNSGKGSGNSGKGGGRSGSNSGKGRCRSSRHPPFNPPFFHDLYRDLRVQFLKCGL
eukprot:TRINITY_DN73511_c0_g1_i1.p1 TRINITY_DN73511_c0_g1~~TRINITY_DN73511_c0_g1_i1.p1  ORF type:complete len:230 (+),score=22.08 TRINITY_DN73511_c0_g1_i1:1-690(+)